MDVCVVSNTLSRMLIQVVLNSSFSDHSSGNATEKITYDRFPTLMTVAASPWSRVQNANAWQN